MDETEILQQNHYYPFGMNMEGAWSGGTNKYQYNGKELNEDFGLGWNDYGARWYDAGLGRFMGLDLLAEATVSFSPYSYSFNNPIIFNDPTGMVPEFSNGAVNTQSTFSGWQQEHEETRTKKKERQQQNNAEPSIDATIANEANISTEDLISITNNISDIYKANGFSENLFNFKILGKGEGQNITFSDGLFLALVNKSIGRYAAEPGNSVLNSVARVEGWSGTRYLSYVNSYFLTKDFGFSSDLNWNIGYVMAHEYLHQLLQKADFRVNGNPPSGTSYNGHQNSMLNLNMEGTNLVLKRSIAQGYNPCGQACHIQINQAQLIWNYLNKK